MANDYVWLPGSIVISDSNRIKRSDGHDSLMLTLIQEADAGTWYMIAK